VIEEMPMKPLPEEFDTPQFRKGLAIRREVLGAAYVDKSVHEGSEFMRPMQKLTTEWAWGEIWSRPGLDRKTRSLLNLAMLTALNRPHEIRLHVRGAVNNGVTVEEIQEVLLQAGIYCGVPAALDAFKVADAVLREIEAERAGGKSV
jgi:4-carboxymuconolactone decarboxylase